MRPSFVFLPSYLAYYAYAQQTPLNTVQAIGALPICIVSNSFPVCAMLDWDDLLG